MAKLRRAFVADEQPQPRQQTRAVAEQAVDAAPDIPPRVRDDEGVAIFDRQELSKLAGGHVLVGLKVPGAGEVIHRR